ncbi:hypothetical protein Riv7116_0973 [Rivularia sp. PCC 7116]|uniref:hypothetical protein n=1 Tax=Rivularia sp. PCC 7116 TaxID=373994 RepID=UPI00029F042C|nr:hypothetical protein [Rivularia sp. PCC 7116]AFY53548.1 hypothetical protein Riv7116_0973 [Rivularia sp. PCC 7116]
MTQMLREEVRERLGNIDQIRDIIFGAQIREYETRFGKLESEISLLQQEMRSHVEQLKVSFTAELKVGFENLEKKLKLFNLNNEEEAADLRLCVDRLNRKFSHSVQSLDEELDSQTKSIREDVSQTKVQLEEEVMALRDLVLEEIEQRFSNLRQSKVSKDDMAETLFALGMRLKEKEFIPMLREAGDESSENHSVKMLRQGDKKLSELLANSNSNGSTKGASEVTS